MVTVSCRAANSLGALTYDTYVFLFDLTTGKTVYNWEARADSALKDSWGARKMAWYNIKNEILMLKAPGSSLTELPRETVDRLMSQVKGQ